MRVTGISWAGVLTEDFEATLHFFSEFLGLSLDYRDEARVLAHFRLPSGDLLEVYGPSNRQRKEKYRWFNGPALGFEVEDVEGARQEMIAHGVRFITEVETWEGDAYALFLGPEDKLFEIQRPVRKHSKKTTRLLGFSGGEVVMHDFAEAVRFFSQVMKMPLAQSDASSESAHFELPAGHLFEVLGPNNNWGRLTPYAAIAFEVEEVGRARRELEAKGVEFVGDIVVTDSSEAFTYFRGPDSYLYKLRKLAKSAAESK
jgi:catechol 2,3-dioxygenase-like lactoylglutathione lyase family enzyme